MVALPLNTAPHFVFYYRFCNSLDFYCTMHPKNCFYHFQGLFMIFKEIFSKFKDNSMKNCTFLEFQEFSRTKVIFKDFSRSVRTLWKFTQHHRTTRPPPCLWPISKGRHIAGSSTTFTSCHLFPGRYAMEFDGPMRQCFS